MELSARDIHEKQFHDAWRGYNQEEVDDFLDRVAEILDRTQRENEALGDRLRELEQALAQARQGEETLKKTLLTAQAAADESIQKARRQAQQMIGEAEARARKATEESRERATALETEARRKAQEIERAGEQRRREVDATIERLRTFETELKQKLKGFLDHQQRTIESLTEHRTRPSTQPGSGRATGAGAQERRPRVGGAADRPREQHRPVESEAPARTAPTEAPQPSTEQRATHDEPQRPRDDRETEGQPNEHSTLADEQDDVGQARRSLRSLFGRDQE